MSSAHVACLKKGNDVPFLSRSSLHMIKSPPFKERKLPLSYCQYSGEIFCSPAKYSFLPESCHSVPR